MHSSLHPQRRLTHWQGYGAGDLSAFYTDDFASIIPDELLRRRSLLPAATAAAALASLHNHRPDFEWDSDPVSSPVAVRCSFPRLLDMLTQLLLPGRNIRPRLEKL